MVVWYADDAWVTTPGTSSITPPSLSHADWTQIGESNYSAFTAGIPSNLQNNYIYAAMSTVEDGNFSVKKTADHAFTVEWIAAGTAVSYKLLDFEGTEISEGTVIDNKVDLVMEKDGVYVVQFLMSDSSIQYADIYDFTDSEKCYLNLMKNTLCDCIDCEDCPGPEYARALNYVNTYILLRDIVYVEQSINVGLTSTSTYKSEYVKIIGMLINKLSLLTKKCGCDEG